MPVLITGATGLIGSALADALEAGGERVLRLTRRPSGRAGELGWDPNTGRLDRASLVGIDAVCHLAGESIASGRWSAALKSRIRDSRIRGTRTLTAALAGLERPPRVWVSASAIGYYGDRGEELLSETSSAGTGFLADLARDWEAAAMEGAGPGTRVVCLRTGIVLSPSGGALARLLPMFRLGLGGPIGNGAAWWSWIGLDDVVAIYRFALATPTLDGPVNAVAPVAVTNTEFTRALARVLDRPAMLRVPAIALRIAFGEMADQALLASTRVSPRRLEAAGFRFRHPELEPALRRMLEARPRGPMDNPLSEH